MLSNVRELDHPAGRLIGAVRVAVACWKGFAEPINSIHTNAFLNVQVVLRHAHIGMSHDALDGREVNTQRLHLTDIGMSAAVRRKQPYLRDSLQRLAELIAEVGGVTRLIYLAGFPDGIQEVSGSIPLAT